MGARRLRRRLSVEIAAGIVLAVAGTVVMSRGPDRRSGALLCGAAAAWLIAEWDNPGAPSAILFTLGIALGTAAPALLAHALLVHGRDRLGTVAALAAVGGAYAALAVLAGIGSTLVADPGASGCSSCPTNLLRVTDAPNAVGWLERWGLRLGAAALTAAAVLVVWRLWRASAAARRTIAPVLLPGVVFLGLVVAHQVHDISRGWIGTDQLDQTLRLAEVVALFAVALGVGWQRLAARRIRGRLAGLVVEMTGAVRPGSLRDLISAPWTTRRSSSSTRSRGLDRSRRTPRRAADLRSVRRILAGAGRRGGRGGHSQAGIARRCATGRGARPRGATGYRP
jgi:hypothetical protein